MRWIKASERLPTPFLTHYLKFKDGTVKYLGYHNSNGYDINNFYIESINEYEDNLEEIMWLDESEDTHTPDNSFRAEVAKSVLAALMSKEWSDIDLACEQAVKAADKLIKKLNQ